jgi:ribonucleoside-diphosphate reductase beta chain
MMFVLLVKADGTCPYCDKAVSLLDSKQLEYTTIPMASMDHVNEYLKDLNPEYTASTYPQIIRDSTIIGGYDKLCDLVDEPLLQENPLRFTLFPIQHQSLFDMYTKAIASFWTPAEISLAEDVQHWKTLSDDDRYFIKNILAFFAGSDGIVMENLAMNFLNEVQSAEARQFYSSQIMIEAIHSETYSLLIDALAEPGEALHLFQAIETMPPVRKKAAWALKYLDSSKRFAERLIAFVCVEGILFSASFCAIYWLKRRGIMPGLCLANEFISRDEGLHYQFGVEMYTKYIKHALPHSTVETIIREAVDTELAFVCDAIPCHLIGMNSDMMCEYIKFVADRAMMDLTGKKIYNATNPFPWMELIGLDSKVNFFERFPSQYQRAGVMTKPDQQTFAVDDEF